MSLLYDRQKTLSLQNYDKCFVIGCGGIGNWVALDLALTGCINKLILIDPDIVEESNLNRTMFDYMDINCYKVDAIARHISLKRPNQDVYTVTQYMTDELAERIKGLYFDNDCSYYHSDICIVDCRDDIYEDCYGLNCKLYKVGYDGCEITIDGNPRLTKVYGQRGGSYSVTPSYVCSSQLAAILVVNDLLYLKLNRMMDTGKVNYDKYPFNDHVDELFPYVHKRACYEHDEMGRINDMVNIDTTTIINQFVTDKHDYVFPVEDYSNLPNNTEEE
jgi:hypothetical protein